MKKDKTIEKLTSIIKDVIKNGSKVQLALWGDEILFSMNSAKDVEMVLSKNFPVGTDEGYKAIDARLLFFEAKDGAIAVHLDYSSIEEFFLGIDNDFSESAFEKEPDIQDILSHCVLHLQHNYFNEEQAEILATYIVNTNTSIPRIGNVFFPVYDDNLFEIRNRDTAEKLGSYKSYGEMMEAYESLNSPFGIV